MKISHRWFPGLLGLIATASLATLLCAGCGDGGGAGADLSSDTTPAAIGVARDPSGTGIFVAFFDEAGVPVAVERAIFEGLVSVEPQAGLNAMAFKAEGAGAITFIWNSLSTSVKIMPVGLTACSSFELCIGDGVLPKVCEGGDCLPLDIAGCYDIAAGKSAGDLLSIEGETGCYDDFVVSSFSFVGGAIPTVTISIYAGSASPSTVPAVSQDVEEIPMMRGVGERLLIAGNIDGGDSPKLVIGGDEFIAVPVVNEVLPGYTEDNYASIGDVHRAADAGDVDGDGVGDLLIHEIISDSEATVHLLPGGSLVAGIRSLNEYRTIGLVPPALGSVGFFGGMGGGADINGLPTGLESFDDVLVKFSHESKRGILAVYFGRGDFDGTHDAILLGEPPSALVSSEEGLLDDGFGGSVVLGDVDGDGYADILTSATLSGSNLQGALYLFRGGEHFVSMTANTAWMKIVGERDYQQLGGSPFLGDVNGDGFGDFAARSKDDTGVPQVHIFFGAGTDELRGLWSLGDAVAVTIYAEDGVGTPIPLGDIDGDGTTDFAVFTKDKILCIFLGGALEEKIGLDKMIHAMDADLFIEDFAGEDIDWRAIAGRVPR